MKRLKKIESYIEEKTGHYACTVQALYICSELLGVADYSKVKTDYMNIWKATGTTIIDTESGINYGSTPTSNVGTGFVKHLKDNKKKTGVTSTQKTSAPFSFFTSAVKKRHVSTLSFSVKGSGSGHSVAVEGYATYKHKSSGKKLNVLLVADGWKAQVRYLNFNAAKYDRMTGTKWSGITVQ